MPARALPRAHLDAAPANDTTELCREVVVSYFRDLRLEKVTNATLVQELCCWVPALGHSVERALAELDKLYDAGLLVGDNRGPLGIASLPPPSSRARLAGPPTTAAHR